MTENSNHQPYVDAGKCVLITGSSSGIGLSAARAFAERGQMVFASMRGGQTRGEELRAEADAQNWRLATPDLDVTSDASVQAAVAQVLAATGGVLDTLVANAGIYVYGAMEDTTADDLRAQLETNLLGVLRVARAVLPAMRARGRGRIIIVGSIAGRTILPATGPYQISKWALSAMAETFRYEVAPFGIRVVLIEPGPFATRLHDNERRVGPRDSVYETLIATYEKQASAMKRAPVDGVVHAIVRAATTRRPGFRWPVGPLSVVGPLSRWLLPAAIYEWGVRRTFGWLRARGPASLR